MSKRPVEEYDASSVVGLADVILESAPAFVCDRCGHVMFEDVVVESITHELARLIVLQGEELRPTEVRFLRELMGMTQAELAERLGINRATVNRWEMGDDLVGAIQSLALRTLAAWCLNDPALAQEIGAPRRQATRATASVPYRLGSIAA